MAYQDEEYDEMTDYLYEITMSCNRQETLEWMAFYMNKGIQENNGLLFRVAQDIFNHLENHYA